MGFITFQFLFFFLIVLFFNVFVFLEQFDSDILASLMVAVNRNFLFNFLHL